jgi:hypothetical protein
MQWRTERGGLGVSTSPKLSRIPQFRGKYIRNNLIRKRGSLICKLSGTPDWGATVPRSPFSLPSAFNWICWHPPPSPSLSPRTKFLGTPRVQCDGRETESGNVTMKLNLEVKVSWLKDWTIKNRGWWWGGVMGELVTGQTLIIAENRFLKYALHLWQHNI